MIGVSRLSSIPPAGAQNTPGTQQVKQEARTAIGEIGHRVLAWTSASARTSDSGSTAWASAAGAGSDFAPDAGKLAGRGDIYDLQGMSSAIASRMGGTPAQEGALHRALGDFARAAMVQAAGLSGASPEQQTAGLRDALENALGGDGEDGIDGVTARIEQATATLVGQNGG
ncbi:hypothetical protein HZF05_08730 [Sphingomonas sp. CGMCC 1.13654]|uniref:Uncharacterized protein n=1 Tax=Sphingomonas chungangi TaxID=2683589 RepID=A0A838L4U4_9SPHN|nr:hypothetical protein [Sphingomonas chungangi]MBA2934184.1 hypothetical protein [Sphingomonas chungangi]MVW57225.1 hypothetical protein [Sphingomonas chungangi]